MTTAKHTPGPWTIATDRPAILTVNGRADPTIAELNPYARDETEIAAHARLLAAAPDMARALLAAFPILTRLAEQQRQARPSGLMEGPECNTAEYLVYLEARAALKAAGVES